MTFGVCRRSSTAAGNATSRSRRQAHSNAGRQGSTEKRACLIQIYSTVALISRKLRDSDADRRRKARIVRLRRELKVFVPTTRARKRRGPRAAMPWQQ